MDEFDPLLRFSKAAQEARRQGEQETEVAVECTDCGHRAIVDLAGKEATGGD